MSNTGICQDCGERVDLDTCANHYDDFGYWLGICDKCVENAGYVGPREKALKDQANGSW